MKLHEKAKKKFNSWGRKKKPKTDNPPDDLGAKPAEFPPPPAPPVFADLACAFGPDDFLDGACSRDAEKSDSTTSPGPPSPCSPPCLSPADGMVDGDQFINKLFSDIIPGNDDTSDCDTDGERTLVGDDLSRPETPSLASDGDEVFLSPRSDSSGGLGF
nr:hypothetical protein BaRGS_011058 [Batillaria attramentaria]